MQCFQDFLKLFCENDTLLCLENKALNHAGEDSYKVLKPCESLCVRFPGVKLEVLYLYTKGFGCRLLKTGSLSFPRDRWHGEQVSPLSFCTKITSSLNYHRRPQVVDKTQIPVSGYKGEKKIKNTSNTIFC